MKEIASGDDVTYWMACVMTGVSILSFITLNFIPANYGRYYVSSSKYEVRGVTLLRYGILPSLLVPILLWLWTGLFSWNKLPNILLMAAFVLHYFHRSFIYSRSIKPSNPVTLTSFVCAVVFAASNGYMQARYFIKTVYPDDWMFEIKFVAGSLLFVVGMLVNIHSDHILGNLRKPGDTGYKIPRGGCFEWVSGANYFGEIIEWIGFAVAAWSFPAAAFALLTISNIGPRAVHHHRWYLEHFKDYPRNRKALIPFLI